LCADGSLCTQDDSTVKNQPEETTVVGIKTDTTTMVLAKGNDGDLSLICVRAPNAFKVFLK